MAKFKKGDVVQYAEHYAGGAYYRDKATVLDVLSSGRIRVHTDDSGVCTEAAEDLELVTPAVAPATAVRTVTRREIVPGVYGLVTVFPDGAVHVSGVDRQSPSDIRAAAKLFNELADVLEENA